MSRRNTAANWQAALYARHADWIEGPYMSVGDGWSDVVSRLFDRISAAVASEPSGTRVSILDIKEKYGSLAVSILAPVEAETDAAIDHAILLAEMRSECSCDECGEEGKLRSTLGVSGWLAVKCRDHAEGYPVLVAKGPPRRLMTDRNGTFDIVYDRRTDTVSKKPVADEDSC